MGYVENNLMKDEDVVYKADIHWFIFIPGAILLSFAILMLIGAGDGAGKQGATLGIIFLGLSIFLLIKALIVKKTTELAVTSKRVIAKTGLISRNTVELNHSKVESFNIDQSIFGRIFGYGTLIINGTGGGKTPIPSIDSPLEFRKYAMEMTDGS